MPVCVHMRIWLQSTWSEDRSFALFWLNAVFVFLTPSVSHQFVTVRPIFLIWSPCSCREEGDCGTGVQPGSLGGPRSLGCQVVELCHLFCLELLAVFIDLWGCQQTWPQLQALLLWQGDNVTSFKDKMSDSLGSDKIFTRGQMTHHLKMVLRVGARVTDLTTVI